MTKPGCLATFYDRERFESAFRQLPVQELQGAEAFSPFALTALDGPEPRYDGPGIVTLGAALLGCLAAFGIQTLAQTWASPYDAGGRPLFSWPAYIPITFVFSVLCGGSALFLAAWWWFKLPEPHHPLFDLHEFRLDEDRFHIFVPITERCPREPLERLLTKLGADSVREVAL